MKHLFVVGASHEQDMVFAVAAALSPFLDVSIPLQVVPLNAATPSANGNSLLEKLGDFLTHLRSVITLPRKHMPEHPFQYFLPGCQSDKKNGLKRISLSAHVVPEEDDVILSVIDSQTPSVFSAQQRVSDILTSVLAYRQSVTLLLLLDEEAYVRVADLVKSYAEKGTMKILLLVVPQFAPPSLDYALTEVSVVASDGLCRLVPALCASIGVGVLQAAPVAGPDMLAPMVPADIAVNVALFSFQHLGSAGIPDSGVSYVTMGIGYSADGELCWHKLRDYVTEYFLKNVDPIHTLFPEKALLSSQPALSFLPPLASILRGNAVTSSALLDQFRSSQRKKELLFQLSDKVNSVAVEKLCSRVEDSWNSMKQRVNPLSLEQSAQERYNALLRLVSSRADLLPCLCYLTTAHIDWKMYVQLICRGSLSHMARYFVCHPVSTSVSYLALPAPRHEFMRLSASKDIEAYTPRYIAGTVSFYLYSGMGDNGKQALLQPGITPSRVISILAQPEVQRVISAVSLHEGTDRDVVQKRSERILLRIGDTLNYFQSRITGTVVYSIFARIYHNVEINQGAYEQLRCLTHLPRVQVVLVLLHRSYADFLIMSLLLHSMNLEIPHVVSGEDFLKMGIISDFMRGTGAFFMRRSFKNDPLYTALFKEYIRQLVLHGQMTEFFIEGGRSRTGKTLQPRMGILKFITDAFLDNQKEVADVLFVPISLSYDQLLESPMYAKELMGVPKPKETVLNMLKGLASMKQEYGSINIHVGEAVSLKREQTVFEGLATETTSTESAPRSHGLHSDSKYKTPPQLLARLSSKLIDVMEKNTVITSTALVASALECLRDENTSEEKFEVSIDALQDNVTLVKRWVLERSGKVTGEVSASSMQKILQTGLKHLESEVVVSGGSSVCFVRPLQLSRMSVHMSTNQLVHLFIDEAAIAVTMHALGSVCESNGQKLLQLRRDMMINTTNIICRTLSGEFPHYSNHKSDTWLEDGLRRLALEGGEDSVCRSIQNSKGDYQIPITKLYYFASFILFPHIDAFYTVVFGIKTLFSALNKAPVQVRAATTSIHRALKELYSVGQLPFVVSCALDPIRHHCDSLVALGITRRDSINGTPVFSVETTEESERLERLAEQVKKLQWKPLKNDDENTISSIIVQTYNEECLKAKI